ncbi:acylphosphatase [Salinibacterium hongtaonis]|uniref:acylphosphatase n=1 Tax=Homoserinimonas hongtaonis TaxID=2079791 RepID=UPI001E5CEA9E|nr:acylphosphatase [Salinibacterium hongtaonis]
MTARIVRRRAVVHGEVQGVGFRWNARAAAQGLAVSGWVRNVPDGTVEAEIEGDEASVDAMIEWLRHGPPFAEVTRVDVTDIAVTDIAVTDIDVAPLDGAAESRGSGGFEIRGI